MKKKIIPLKLKSPTEAPVSNEILEAKITALMNSYNDKDLYDMGKRSAYNDVLLMLKGK